MNPQKRRDIFERLAKANPNPTTELEYGTPFELLVAVVLSAQATDKSVNLATRRLFPSTPQKIADLGVEGLEQYIKSIGLYRTKAKNVVALSEILLKEHGGEVPRSREALERLPGVGRKTANVVLNTAFGEPTVAVDTHIFRVANRTGLAPGKDVVTVENRLLKFTPPEYLKNAHHWLILHGRYVCLARKPGCPQCLIRDLCEYRQKTKDDVRSVTR
ncbi:MAG TPA: endonuclease III [Burkholderiales bacterium]|nr:endonuclease III [Burkholderiales bacterium]